MMHFFLFFSINKCTYFPDMGQEEDYSMFEAFIVALASVWADSGFSALTSGNVIMIGVGLVLLYMAIGKGF